MILLNMKINTFHGIPWNSMELQKSSMELLLVLYLRYPSDFDNQFCTTKMATLLLQFRLLLRPMFALCSVHLHLAWHLQSAYMCRCIMASAPHSCVGQLPLIEGNWISWVASAIIASSWCYGNGTCSLRDVMYRLCELMRPSTRGHIHKYLLDDWSNRWISCCHHHSLDQGQGNMQNNSHLSHVWK